jgi:carbon monoxide dehydrogenase subunit G
VKLSGTYALPAPRARVFAALVDPDVLLRCIDGAERLVRTADDEYDVHLRLGIGAVKGSYVGAARIADKQPPERFTLHVEGKGAPGFVRGSALIQLREEEGRTEAICDADGQVGGVMAAVGSRLLEATARKLMDRFFERLAGELAGGQ